MAEGNSASGCIAVCAGGTGGHLFPAEALSAELKARGYRILLMTDDRGLRYGDRFPCDEIQEIPSATLSLRAPLKAIVGVGKLGLGVLKSYSILKRSKVRAIAGFGGYPSFPPMVAGSLLKLPACLHEQNAVMGRANKALARFATVLATSFEQTQRIPNHKNLQVVTTGNPVRAQVIGLRDVPYESAGEGEPFKLLVFGGSQGARVFSEIVPAALALLPEATKKRLVVTQQCRAEDIDQVSSAYGEAGIDAELAIFFDNLPERISKSHLVVARSGASTVSELTVIGRPSILIPLPHSLDNDQRENARALAQAGGAWLLEQTDFTPEHFAKMLEELFNQPEKLNKAAQAAHETGRPEAVKHLADAVEEIAKV